MDSYDHKKIEKKWRETWKKSGIFAAKDSEDGKENFYLLVEFPYPSGNLHVGHWYAFAVPDILARFKRMKGKNVLYPIGFDAFGLPAENAAIKRGLNPRKWTEENIAYMTKQIESMGASFDWSRKVSTIDPEYYKWTQWMFLQFYKNGLVYQKDTAVNWCPKDKTVLANEQVVDGKCERCDSEVEQKLMLQWNIKITDYADRLIDDLTNLDWPEQIKDSQRNWIGRSEGAEIDFQIKFEDADTPNRSYLLLHGKGGSPGGAFWPYLKGQLERRGYEVAIPALPNPEEPNADEQADYLLKNHKFTDRTVIVGHSFGGIVALRLLEKGVKADMVTLVGTPSSGTYLDGRDRPTVTSEINKGFDAEKIRANAKAIVLLYDTEDDRIPVSDGELLAEITGGSLFKEKAVKPHFLAPVEPRVLAYADATITVFTTRPDTLFGATYLVLSPEHLWVQLALKHKSVLKNNDKVQEYADAAKKKTELERMTDQKEKTGVKLEGVYAINPATGEKIPMYVADYVLATYGTGAIMAVPAHDERDFEFAQKHDIPMRQVVVPCDRDAKNPPRAGLEEVKRDTVIVHLRDKSTGKFAILDWHGSLEGITTAIMGGVEKGQTPEEAALSEVAEESAIPGAKIVKSARWVTAAKYCASHKNQNRCAHTWGFLAEVESLKDQGVIPESEMALHTLVWVDEKDVLNRLTPYHQKQVWQLLNHDEAIAGEGYLINSGKYDGTESVEARIKIAEEFGRKKTTYKLRDWIVSRQRYWGVPIPMIHCGKCGTVPVPDSDLPVQLPEVEDYLPSGEGKSPLAKVDSFVNVKCPSCKGDAKRETDTLDTFVDSSWYFLRYTDPSNNKEFAASDKMKPWMPVTLYSGGAEHTTMHLLYSRFWHKALYDLKLVGDSEPYARRMNRSLIMGPDGQKMSKSKGNVIDPDEVVERLGADTVRMYLAFIGPYSEVASYPWNPDGVVGVRRFIERLWRMQEMVIEGEVEALTASLHKTIKKVGDDIEVLKFNTAISQLMIFLNHAEKEKKIGMDQWKTLLKLIEPFAPHIADELWSRGGHQDQLLEQEWPVYSGEKLVDKVITIAVQINGKTRATVDMASESDKSEMESAAHAVVAPRILGKKVGKTIIVPGRLVNFVLEE